MSPAELFNRVVASSSLGAVAPFAMARALRRIGVARPELELTPELIDQAMPHIEEVLRIYLGARWTQAAAEIRKLGRPGPAGAGDLR